MLSILFGILNLAAIAYAGHKMYKKDGFSLPMLGWGAAMLMANPVAWIGWAALSSASPWRSEKAHSLLENAGKNVLKRLK